MRLTTKAHLLKTFAVKILSLKRHISVFSKYHPLGSRSIYNSYDYSQTQTNAHLGCLLEGKRKTKQKQYNGDLELGLQGEGDPGTPVLFCYVP